MIKGFERIRGDLLYRPFWAFESWMRFIEKVFDIMGECKKNKGSELSEYAIQILYEGSDIRLNIHCLDPADGFSQIMKFNPRNIILTSGTLSPLKSWELELKVKFAQPMSCAHILSKEQVNTLVVSMGHDEKEITMSYENRGDVKMY